MRGLLVLGPILGFHPPITLDPGRWAIDRHRCLFAWAHRHQRAASVALARADPRCYAGAKIPSTAARRVASHRGTTRCRRVTGLLCKRYLANVCDSLLHTRRLCQHPCLEQTLGPASSQRRGWHPQSRRVGPTSLRTAAPEGSFWFSVPFAGGERCLRAVPGRSPRLRQRC